MAQIIIQWGSLCEKVFEKGLNNCNYLYRLLVRVSKLLGALPFPYHQTQFQLFWFDDPDDLRLENHEEPGGKPGVTRMIRDAKSQRLF